jgi:hypothetical protein
MRPSFEMKKSKGLSERDVLELLKTVLPKHTSDIDLASKIINDIQRALQQKNQHAAFEKFCERVELPSMEAATVMEVKKQFQDAFGDDVKITQDKKGEALHIELQMPDGPLTANIKVGQTAGPESSDEQEVTLKFVPFPVALPSDPELVWLLAKRENLNPEEAAVTLAKVEEEFWATKSGQKLIRDRVERTFAEFVSRVPSKMLSEGGLKRHYKEPEPIKQFRTLNGNGARKK